MGSERLELSVLNLQSSGFPINQRTLNLRNRNRTCIHRVTADCITTLPYGVKCVRWDLNPQFLGGSQVVYQINRLTHKYGSKLLYTLMQPISKQEFMEYTGIAPISTGLESVMLLLHQYSLIALEGIEPSTKGHEPLDFPLIYSAINGHRQN